MAITPRVTLGPNPAANLVGTARVVGHSLRMWLPYGRAFFQTTLRRSALSPLAGYTHARERLASKSYRVDTSRVLPRAGPFFLICYKKSWKILEFGIK